MKVICNYCGKEVDKKSSYVKTNARKGHKNYCSSICQYKGQIKGE